MEGVEKSASHASHTYSALGTAEILGKVDTVVPSELHLLSETADGARPESTKVARSPVLGSSFHLGWRIMIVTEARWTKCGLSLYE